MSAPEVIKAPSPATDKEQGRISIAELRNGKVYFKQKPLSFEKQSETLQEIVKFRDMLEARISKQEPPLTSFPNEHKPLVAKLAHESDKTLTALSKHIHHELLPTLDDDEDKDLATSTSAALPLGLIEEAIGEILVRRNYGLEAPLGVRLPAAVSVWRWEVTSEHWDWLPKNSREKAESRQAERAQAKDDLRVLFEALPQEDRDAIIDPKASNKLPSKELNKPHTSKSAEPKAENNNGTPQSSKKQGKKKVEETENNDKSDLKETRLKKVLDPEKAAKEKERLEKRAARVEKEKKEKDAHNKSQSIMAKFFSKPPKTPAKPVKAQDSAIAGPSKIKSDFEKTFKPFVLQKDRTMAPSNWFLGEKRRKRESAKWSNKTEVITLDSDEEVDIETQNPQPSEQELAAMTSQERLQDIISSLPASTSLSTAQIVQKQRRSQGFKVHHTISVRDLMSQLSEAEISLNDELVRNILDKLRNRELLPAKAFCFHTDTRPGYYGTWTRSSRIIGPRNPLAKDTLVFDYGYDSGEEWEQESVVGEEVEDDGKEEDGDAEDPDSDLDSWLVDDDEEPDMANLDPRNSPPPPFFDFPNAPPKRKAEDTERKIGKKRKVVVPLVPFAKGPVWESTIGVSQYEPFKPYAIQLFNDTPLSIDPFTFVSSCVEDYRASLKTGNLNVPTNAMDTIFAVPALPPRLVAANPATTLDGFSSNSPLSNANIPKKPPAVPKSVFPEAHVQFLLNKITQLQASSINALVESIYLDLREYKVKKIAIETKVKEVGEKCKEKRVWVIKSALLQQPQVS